MFFKKPKPKPAKSLATLKREFSRALDKLVDEFEAAGLYAGEAQDMLKHKAEQIDQFAAMSCVRKPHWHPDPTPVRVYDNTDVTKLADLIRGHSR